MTAIRERDCVFCGRINGVQFDYSDDFESPALPGMLTHMPTSGS